MATMYETIMNLPLLKGVSKELVSSFLEKTHVQFVNYNDGEKLIEKGETCSYIKYIISGRVKVTNRNYSGTLAIEEIRTAGAVLAPEHLFGMETKYPFDAVAEGNVSVMQFSKEQYMNLLQTDTIYMLNYLNYLSYHSQRPIIAIKLLSDGSFESQLALWVMSMTDSDSAEIRIICDMENLLKMTHFSPYEMESALQRIKSDGLIDYDENKIIIKSRSRLIDSVFEKMST